MNHKEIECLVTDEVRKQLEQDKLAEQFLTPEQLCERWHLTMRCLEKWRVEGKPPVYMKIQGGERAKIRYPLHIKNGVLDVERQWIRTSTTDPGGGSE